MRVAGIRRTGGAVELIDVPEPRSLAADEVLIEVRSTGVGNWDEIVGPEAGMSAVAHRWRWASRAPAQ